MDHQCTDVIKKVSLHERHILLGGPSSICIDSFSHSSGSPHCCCLMWHNHLTCWLKTFVLRCQVDLSVLSREQTHKLELQLEEGEGHLVLLVTLTASATVSISDLSANSLEDQKEREEILKRYVSMRVLLPESPVIDELTVYPGSQIYFPGVVCWKTNFTAALTCPANVSKLRLLLSHLPSNLWNLDSTHWFYPAGKLPLRKVKSDNITLKL